MGFSDHTEGQELQQIREINSLLIGGEQRGPHQSSPPTHSSTMCHLRLNESRPQSHHRNSAQFAKLSFADHPDMRVLSSAQASPRRASAPQSGFHVSTATSHPVQRQLSYIYSCMYSDCSFGSNNTSDIAQHLTVAHQRADATCPFDVSSSFNPFPGMSSSRPTTSDSDFSNGSAESMFGFPPGSTSPSLSPADELRFGFYQDPNLVKMENATAGVDIVAGWNNSGFFGLDAMGGFDAFGNVPPC